MPHKGPHISISAEYVVNRILRINLDEFDRWPQSVRQLAIDIAELYRKEFEVDSYTKKMKED